jgi:hypothetical protein
LFTQTLAAAVCLYLVIGRRQTPLQMAALALLLTACEYLRVLACIHACNGSSIRLPPNSTYLTIFNTRAAIMLNLPKGNKGKGGAPSSSMDKASLEATTFYLGVVPVLLASLTSGICAALTQKTLQVGTDDLKGRSSRSISRSTIVSTLPNSIYITHCRA